MKLIATLRGRRSDQGLLTVRWLLLSIVFVFGMARSENPVPSEAKETAPPKQQTRDTKKPATKDQRGTEKQPLIVKVVDAPKAETKATKDEEKSSDKPPFIWGMTAEEAAAVFTGLLVVVGALTAAVLMFQSILIRQQVKAARKEFVASHRPKLIVRRFQLRPKGNGPGFFVRFVVANTGETKAKIVLDNVTIKILGSDEMHLLKEHSFPVYEGQVDVLKKREYEPAERQAQEIHLGGIKDEPAARKAIREGTAGLACFGFIRYQDPSGGEQETRFFRTHQLGEKFLVPSDDPDYEYK